MVKLGLYKTKLNLSLLNFCISFLWLMFKLLHSLLQKIYLFSKYKGENNENSSDICKI